MIPEIRIEDYNYNLPEDRIAKYPLPERDSSKLLVYKGGECSQRIFREIPELLPENSIMVFNNTRVVPARLFFRRPTGAHIEIFCLFPVDPAEYVTAFETVGKCRWRCVIGNSKRWKEGKIDYAFPLEHDIHLQASLVELIDQTGIVEFTWEGEHTFSDVLDLCGKVPIPPYLNRDTEKIDLERYQTTYANIRGSVAAPTAGLHFTPEIQAKIEARGIANRNVCLHVGAGTFLPVKSSRVAEHTMHREPIVVRKSVLEDLCDTSRKVIAVGTTSMRTLESLYYIGVSIIETGEPAEVKQWSPYEKEYTYTREEAFRAIIGWLERNNLDEIKEITRIIIVPGFKFRVVDVLVTNFHQPQSTLILLVSAFVGGDWKTIYNFALSNGFRFLSYGDSSLLFRQNG